MYKSMLLFFLILAITFPLSAAEYESGNVVTIAENDTIYSDLFSGCRSLDVLGVVQGDVYVGSETVSVEGRVEDDVLAGCRRLEIRGVVGDGVIAFAQTIVIDGEVNGDVLAFGGQVRITERANIKGNLFTGTGDLFIEGGHIGGYVKGGAAEVYLNGKIGGRVELEAGDIDFGEDYSAAEGTKLVLHKPLEAYELDFIPDNLEVSVKRQHIFFETAFFYWSLFALLIVGIIIVGLSKRFSREYIDFTQKQTIKSFGYGFLILIVIPLAVIILAVLVLTIPISLMLLAVYFILVYLSYAFAALFIGDYVMSFFRKESTTNGLFVSMIVGVLLVALLTEVPILGGLFAFLIVCLGMGSLVLYLVQLMKTEKSSVAG